MAQTLKALRSKIFATDNSYDNFVKETNVQSGDRYFHNKSGQECVVTWIDDGSLYTIFNLESGKTVLCTDDYVELVFRLKNGFQK